MNRSQILRWTCLAAAPVCVFALGFCFISKSDAGFRWRKRNRSSQCDYGYGSQRCVDSNTVLGGPAGGAWHWARSPEEEKTVAASLFNRYCIRCHGVDGLEVWD